MAESIHAHLFAPNSCPFTTERRAPSPVAHDPCLHYTQMNRLLGSCLTTTCTAQARVSTQPELPDRQAEYKTFLVIQSQRQRPGYITRSCWFLCCPSFTCSARDTPSLRRDKYPSSDDSVTWYRPLCSISHHDDSLRTCIVSSRLGPPPHEVATPAGCPNRDPFSML